MSLRKLFNALPYIFNLALHDVVRMETIEKETRILHTLPYMNSMSTLHKCKCDSFTFIHS